MVKRRRSTRLVLGRVALPSSLLIARALEAQSIPPGLDKGHRVLLERGFQIHALAVDQPEIPNWTVFDAGGWNGVDFQFNFYGPANYLGPAPGNHVWQATYSDYSHTSFSQVEAPYASNCVRIQLDDEQDLNNSTVRTNVANWFAAARANYPNTILGVNQIPFAATDANFRDFMSTSQPDMLMIDSYRWTSDPSQGTWNLWSDMQRHRKFGLLGNDGTGAHPIPYGFYAQAIDDFPPGSGRVPSESELRFEHFAAWAMGYTLTDDFTYNTSAAYSGVESIDFVNGAQQANPTSSYYQIQPVNAEGKRLGPALVRLLSTDARFVNGYNSSGSVNPNPIDIPNWTQGAGDSYLRSYTVTNVGTKNNGYSGDVLLSWFKALDESLDGSDFSGEKYFAVTNGLVDPTGSAVDCRQQITLNWDFGTSGISTLQRLRRSDGTVEVIPLTQGSGTQYSFTFTLDGGTADFFKFNDGSPFVGIPAAGQFYWDSDGMAAGNDTTTGAGLGGSGTWNGAASRWYDGTANGPWGAIGNAVFLGTAGTVTVASPLTANSLTFKSNGYTLAGSVLTVSSGFVSVDSGVTATISCALSGSGGLVKNGLGTLNLTAANTYSGITMINAGVLGIASGAFSAEPGSPALNLVMNGSSTLRFNGSGIVLSANRQISLGGTKGIIDTNGNDGTVAGTISGPGSVDKISAGTLVLSGANSYSGGTNVDGGTLRVSSDGNLGAAPASFSALNIILNGGSLQFGGNFDISNNRGIYLGALGGTIDTQGFANSGGYGAASGFQGAGDLTKLGSGTFFCTSTSGNNLWTGILILKQGIWKTDSRGGLPINPTTGGLRPAQVTFDGGTLQFNTSLFLSEPNRGITVNSGGGSIDTQGFNVTWAGPVSGSVTTAVLSKSGSGTLRLNSSTTASSYVGGVAVAVGTLELAGGTALGGLSTVSTAAGATLNLINSEAIGALSGTGGSVTLGSTTLTAGGNGASTIYGGVISGSGKLVKTGGGSMVLNGANSYSGGTTISGGVLQIGSGGTSGGIAGNVTNNAALKFSRSDAITFAGAIGGSGSVAQAGPGTLTLSGSNSYGGVTSVTGGTLVAGSANLGNGGAGNNVVLDGGTLKTSGAITTSRKITLGSAGGTINSNGFDSSWGDLDPGDFTKNGSGKVTLRTLWAANVTISGGTLAAKNRASTGGNHPARMTSLSISNAALDLNDNDLIVDYTGASPFTTLQQYVVDGLRFPGDPPATAGISSTTGANATAAGGVILVLFENIFVDPDSHQTFTVTDSWNGATVDLTSVIGKYTYFGDGNLDGLVDGGDYAVVDSGRSLTGAVRWLQGDVNLDGVIDPGDYATIDSNRGQGTAAPLAAVDVSAQPTNVVPEPGPLEMLMFAAWPALVRRRRRR